ncbi:MAG: lipase [Bacteroidaceae bacterium]|nr:lipase [Bacteroidaceae bacterium]
MYADIRHIIRLALCALFFVSLGGGEAMAQSLTTPFPSTFRNTRTNELIDGQTLAPVFKKVHQHKTIKVMQIGDSHVKGNILPRTLGSTLEKYFPRMEFTYYGINGAWARRFYEQDMINRVVAERPDLVIVSFGTNEAHGNTIDERAHAETMKTLTDRISERCPGVCFLFTTPPGSFISQRTGSYTTGSGRRKRTHYTTTKVPNQNTANVARSIVNFCRNHRMAVWDIFTIAGGPTSACTNWRNAGLMNTDCIHYLATGYTLQGKLLGEAIYKTYTGTATSGSQTRMMHGSTPKEQKPYKTVKGF